MNKGIFSVATNRAMQFVDVTALLQREIAKSGVQDGVCYLYNPHTTSGLTINEGADPDVCTDLIGALRQMVPMDYPYQHMEGNSPAHLMATLVGSSVTVFVEDGRLVLGTWQKIFFCEFDGPRSRKVSWRVLAA
ncbi:MAG: secondary thiamine-phosphate synthase enzyme YjbQ [Desulfobulbaceae bacterium]|nr:secondary thiamine-phosphate synthase enzyme YjbQ [Desulfobulbaceae bacterium]